MIAWQAGKLGYQNLWRTCVIKEEHQLAALQVADRVRFAARRVRYEAVAKRTGVPWWLIAAIHQRESSGDFTTQLWQGDPLNKVSTHVPAGKGPYASWEDCAVEAIDHHNQEGMRITSPAQAAWFAEKYNGFGYELHGVNSSYVWGWTNHQQPGFYPRDGQWDPHQWDQRYGCAAVWRALELRGIVLELETPKQEQPMAQAPAVPAAQPHDLEKTLATIRQVSGFANLLTPIIPARWRPLYAILPQLVEDAARWIEAARNPQTSSADVSTLIQLTATHAGSVVQAIKSPAQQ